MQLSKIFLTGTAAVLAVAGVFASKARLNHQLRIGTCAGNQCVNIATTVATVSSNNRQPIFTAAQGGQKVTCLVPSPCASNKPVYTINDSE